MLKSSYYTISNMYKNKNIFLNQQGQVLLLTILISVIVMTIAIAASRRTTVDVKQLNASTESNRALSAAEAGVEEALLALKNGVTLANCHDEASCGIDLGTGKVKSIEVVEQSMLSMANVPTEQTIQVLLHDSAVDFNGVVTLRWDAGTSVVVSVLLRDSSNPPRYALYREAYNCGNGTVNNGFQDISPTNGQCEISVDINDIETNLYPGYTAILMRIRMMYDSSSIFVQGNVDLPTQAFSIDSTGDSGDAERTIQATRTNASLPSIFDFALFNGSSNTLQNIPGGTSWFQFMNGDVHSSGNGGINVDIPGGSVLCTGDMGCVVTSEDGIDTGGGSISDENWFDNDYDEDFNIERFSYDALLTRLSPDIPNTHIGNNLANVQGVLHQPSIVRIKGTGGVVSLNQGEFDKLTDEPTVVFVGNEAGQADVNLEITVPEFINKNVVFIVSGDVVVSPVVKKLEAAVIFDGLMTVKN